MGVKVAIDITALAALKGSTWQAAREGLQSLCRVGELSTEALYGFYLASGYRSDLAKLMVKLDGMEFLKPIGGV